MRQDPLNNTSENTLKNTSRGQSKNAQPSTFFNKKLSNKLRIPLSTLLCTLSILLGYLVVLATALPRALYPSLHMDESYYFGAALHFLRGDIFLNNYSFDKPFLNFMALVPGILIAGRNAFGSHFSGFCFFLVAFVLCTQLCLRIAKSIQTTQIADFKGRVPGVWQPLFTATIVFLVTCLFCSPVFIAYGPGAFAEPFLLVALLAMFHALWNTSQDLNSPRFKRGIFFFCIAICIKPTALLWSPVLLMSAFRRSDSAIASKGITLKHLLSDCFATARSILHTGRWLFALALFYMLTGPQKLIPFKLVIEGFLGGKTSGSGSAFGRSPVDRLSMVSDFVNHSLFPASHSSAALLMLMMAVAASTTLVWTKRNKELMLLVAPFWIHFFALILTRGGLFDRYLFILVPQWLFLIVAFLAVVPSLWASKKPQKRTLLFWTVPFIVGAASFGFVAVSFLQLTSVVDQRWKAALPTPAWGRLFDQLAHELPRGSVVHHHNLKWYLEPATAQAAFRLSCLEMSCMQKERIGRAANFVQFIVKGSPEKDPSGQVLLMSKSIHSKSDVEQGDTAQSSASAIVRQVAETAALSPDTFQQALRFKGRWKLEGFGMNVNEGRVTLSVSHSVACAVTRALSFLDTFHKTECKIELTASGLLTLTSGYLAEQTLGPQEQSSNRWLLGWRLDSFRNGNLTSAHQDSFLLDLVPQLYKSYTLPLSPIEAPPLQSGYLVSRLGYGSRPNTTALTLRPYAPEFIIHPEISVGH